MGHCKAVAAEAAEAQAEVAAAVAAVASLNRDACIDAACARGPVVRL